MDHQPPELIRTDMRVEGPDSEFVSVFINPVTHALVPRFLEKDGQPVVNPGDYYFSIESDQVLRSHRVSDEPWPRPRTMTRFQMGNAA